MSNRKFWIVSPFIIGLVAGCAMEDDTTSARVETGSQPAMVQYYIAHTASEAGDQLYVQAVNEAVTTCLDGNIAEACEVRMLDVSELGLSPAWTERYTALFRSGRGIARGSFKSVLDGEGRMVTALHVTEAWVNATGERPSLDVYQVAAADLYCVRAPCPKYTADQLNTPDDVLLHLVDLDGSGATEEDLAMAYGDLETTSILAAGKITVEGDEAIQYDEDELAGFTSMFAETFYLRIP